jgi:integrase
MRLTDAAIGKRKHPSSGQEFDWDDLVAGFGIRYTPTKASYVVTWREPGGKRPRETLRGARVGAVTVAQARDLARKRLSEVVGNIEAGTAVPLRLAMRTWFERQTELQAWRPRYRAKVDQLIATYIEGQERARVTLTPSARTAIDTLGAKPVGSVQRTDVMRVADAIKRGAADQFMAQISAFYNWSFERGVEVPNPARNRLRVTGGRRVRSRKLNDSEFLTLWKAFKGEGDPNFAAFALLAYTGARRREITGLLHAEVDLDAATITLPPERRKTGKKDPEPFVINLHPAALDTITRQPVLDGSPYVFWGRRDQTVFDFHHSVMTRVKPLVPDWRFHDLRRYMRSGLAQLGVSQTVAEQCLGHKAGGLVGVYDQHSYEAEKADAWRRWGDHLAALTARKGAGHP